MKFLSIAIVASVIFMVSAPSTAGPINADQAIDAVTPAPPLSDATSLFLAGKTDNAIHVLKEIIQQNPNSAEAHQVLGLAFAVKGESSLGIKELKTSMVLNPELSSSWLNMASIYQSEGKAKEAIGTYNDFLKRFPKDPVHEQIRQLRNNLESEIEAIESSASNASSPNIKNNPWSKTIMPLKVYIDPSSQYSSILQKSFAEWSSASDDKVKFTHVDNPQLANIECLWVGDNNARPIEDGDCQFHPNMALTKCTIRIWTTPSAQLPQTNNRIHNVCLHEIGHALGISQHTLNPNDVMFYSVSLIDKSKKISENDKQALQAEALR